MSEKSELQIQIDTAAGFYRAITELDNVAATHGNDLQRAALEAVRTLQKTLNKNIANWNGELGDDDQPLNPQLTLCAGVESWEPWARREKCDVYIVTTGGPMCQECTARKARYDADLAREDAR
jgi:hypothetical protein